MQDLAANITFRNTADGWDLEQDADVITSVQAFLEGTDLIIELWGTTTLVAPDGQRHERQAFQQSSWIRLDDASWRVRRNVHSPDDHGTEDLAFEVAGSARDIARYRRF